jgi:hypothetical protein
MVPKASKRPRPKATAATKRRPRPKIDEAEERILRAAYKYLLFNHGMFLVPTALRKIQIKGIPVWIITVTLRYGMGDEAYIGDLLYDGEIFTFLTEESVRNERADQLANDPERIRKWNEFRASTLYANEPLHGRG